MGISAKTPQYIWNMESGAESIETEVRRGAASYLVSILAMSDERWPEICLREEVRSIINTNPTKWAKEFSSALASVGDDETTRQISEEGKVDATIKDLDRGLKIKKEQEYRKK